MEMRRFELDKDQIDFLKKTYPDEELVKKVLQTEKDGWFEVDVDTKIDFMNWVEDESISWLDDDDEATKETIVLESIRDDIYYQTN